MDRTLRPDDSELVRSATRQVRLDAGAEVVFGGLLTSHEVEITAASGARTRGLFSIRVRRSRGLGGLAWSERRLRSVRDYGRAREITHDFDSQILGEGISGLSVAPIIVNGVVRGLLYAGSRDGAGPLQHRPVLAGVTSDLAQEMRIRDLVDERIQLRMAETQWPCALRDRVAKIAETTTDTRTARELGSLLGPAPAADGNPLTRRQKDVLELAALGLSNRQIADRLSLSDLTIKSYLRTVMSRLNASTRFSAVVEARHRGWL